MHELGIAVEIADIAEQRCEGRAVTRVVVEIGKLAMVVPEALRFAWTVATESTSAAGSDLEIVEVPGRARCRTCSEEFSLDDLLGRCGCGSIELTWLSGSELRVKRLEVV